MSWCGGCSSLAVLALVAPSCLCFSALPAAVLTYLFVQLLGDPDSGN